MDHFLLTNVGGMSACEYILKAVEVWRKNPGLILNPMMGNEIFLIKNKHLAQVYRMTGGMPKGEMDDGMFRLWAFEEVANQRDEGDEYIFGDFGAGVALFSVNKEGNVLRKVEGDLGWEIVWISLNDFFKSLLAGEL